MEMQVSDNYLEIKKENEKKKKLKKTHACILTGVMDFLCIVLPPYS